MSETTLKPCAHCGSDKVIPEGYENRRCSAYISCLNCGTRTGYFMTHAEAAEIWNQRTCGWVDARKQPPEDGGWKVISFKDRGVATGFNSDVAWYREGRWSFGGLLDDKDVYWLDVPPPPGKEVNS